MNRQWLQSSWLAVLIAVAGPAAARIGDTVTVEGAEFAPVYHEAPTRLELAGYGVATARVFFDVYAAALYLPQSTPRGLVLEGHTPRRLEIEYLRPLTAGDLARAANTILERQHGRQTLRRMEDTVARFHALYRDVKAGDRYAMTYIPGEGTALSLNGRHQGRVEGAEFARVYFGIWLGKRPLSESLREALVGRLQAPGG